MLYELLLYEKLKNFKINISQKSSKSYCLKIYISLKNAVNLHFN